MLTYMEEGIFDVHGEPTPVGKILFAPWAIITHNSEHCDSSSRLFTWFEILEFGFGDYSKLIQDSAEHLLLHGCPAECPQLACPHCQKQWDFARSSGIYRYLKANPIITPDLFGVLVVNRTRSWKEEFGTGIMRGFRTHHQMVPLLVWHSAPGVPQAELYRSLALSGLVSGTLEEISDRRADVDLEAPVVPESYQSI